MKDPLVFKSINENYNMSSAFSKFRVKVRFRISSRVVKYDYGPSERLVL